MLDDINTSSVRGNFNSPGKEFIVQDAISQDEFDYQKEI
jgi:hypothetical protein